MTNCSWFSFFKCLSGHSHKLLFSFPLSLERCSLNRNIVVEGMTFFFNSKHFGCRIAFPNLGVLQLFEFHTHTQKKFWVNMSIAKNFGNWILMLRLWKSALYHTKWISARAQKLICKFRNDCPKLRIKQLTVFNLLVDYWAIDIFRGFLIFVLAVAPYSLVRLAIWFMSLPR